MQIKAQPSQTIMLKLKKMRCCTGCLENINYLVFNHGLYCSSCISTLPDLTEDHFINIQQLSKILVEITEQYGQKIKGEVSQLNLIKGQMENVKKDIKKVKDGLSYDLKSVKQKSLAHLDQLFAQCLKQNQNQPLQAFYQPDITATLILNESQLLVQNLTNLKIKKNQNTNKIEYSLKEGNKNPDKINKKVQKEYKELNKCIQQALSQIQTVMSEFAKETS